MPDQLNAASMVRYPTLPPFTVPDVPVKAMDAYGEDGVPITDNARPQQAEENPQQRHRGRLIDRLQQSRPGSALTPPRNLRRRSHPNMATAAAAAAAGSTLAAEGVPARHPVRVPQKTPVPEEMYLPHGPSSAPGRQAENRLAPSTPEIPGYWPQRGDPATASDPPPVTDPFVETGLAITGSGARPPLPANTPVLPGHWPCTPARRRLSNLDSVIPWNTPASPAGPLRGRNQVEIDSRSRHHPNIRRRRPSRYWPCPLPCCAISIILPALGLILALSLPLSFYVGITIIRPNNLAACKTPKEAQTPPPTCPVPLIPALSIPTAAARLGYVAHLARTVATNPVLHSFLVAKTGLRIRPADLERPLETLRQMGRLQDVVAAGIESLREADRNVTRAAAELEGDKEIVKGWLGGGGSLGRDRLAELVVDPFGTRAEHVSGLAERARVLVGQQMGTSKYGGSKGSAVRKETVRLVKRLKAEVAGVCAGVRSAAERRQDGGKERPGTRTGEFDYWAAREEVRDLVAAWWMWCELMAQVGEEMDEEGPWPAEEVLRRLFERLDKW